MTRELWTCGVLLTMWALKTYFEETGVGIKLDQNKDRKAPR